MIKIADFIEETEKTLGHVNMLEAINFIDSKLGNSWAKMLDEMDAAMLSGDRERIDMQLEVYKTLMRLYIQFFNSHKTKTETHSLLNDLNR